MTRKMLHWYLPLIGFEPTPTLSYMRRGRLKPSGHHYVKTILKEISTFKQTNSLDLYISIFKTITTKFTHDPQHGFELCCNVHIT